MPLGANVTPGGVSFCVWAPAVREVALAIDGVDLPMDRQDDGTWFLRLEGGSAGARYKYRLDGGEAYPDPYSRYQPEGVHGPSGVVDPEHFEWRDQSWAGVRPTDLIIYECHIGTFTPEGTFDAAAGKLPYLRDLGVTGIEVMPVAEFSGRRNWGYDGVDWFAPTHNYGGPAGLQRLVDEAHRCGLAVLLDVVYNHFGPEGNYLRQFSTDYFTDRYRTPWGDAINYEGCGSARRLAIDNACRWLGEYHVDGFRLDATFAIHDSSPKHLLRELSEAVRNLKPNAILTAETHENDPIYLRSIAEGGYGFDAVWADDFHHVVRRLVAGDREGYFQDYAGTVEELSRALNQGFLYEGQPSVYSGHPRGKPARDRPAPQFVYCIQNHDQVGNRAFGDRLNGGISEEAYRLVSLLLLLSPYTPLLFMGQEFGASSPFLYFTDHSPNLGKLVTEGRRGEFKSFGAFANPAVRETIPDPQAEATFLASKLPWWEAEDSGLLAFYRECLRVRREDPIISAHDRFAMVAQAVTADVLTVTLGHDQRLLVCNFGDSAFELPLNRERRTVLETLPGESRLTADTVTLPAVSGALLA